MIEDADWPTFGWRDDIRPALRAAMDAGRSVALATLFAVEGSAPRGPGAQMLFDGERASGYFSGDCIEGDVALHAARVLVTGEAKRLHYGMGSPWIDLRLRCGGALHVLVERVAPDDEAARRLLAFSDERRSCVWQSDGEHRACIAVDGAPLLAWKDDPLCITRRHDPPRRMIVSGGDPGALALARLAAEAQFDTVLLRPDGPETPPPFAGVTYLREEPAQAMRRIGVDAMTAYVGATHENDHDLPGCLVALREGAGYVAMIGAASRAAARRGALAAAGATDEELARLRLSPGITGLGKAPWEVATGVLAEVFQTLNRTRERA